ncbi:uncharacterized protein [Amphiura filiformis]|uniref:uncharacterized protein isoform X2 n=1 Tax=Amphiura filiformis TaxID=82378 RepID=UPI003B213388
MSSSDRAVKPKTSIGSTGASSRGGARASTSRSGSTPSRSGATNRPDVSPGTKKVIQSATLKKQMERLKRNIEKEKIRKGGTSIPKSTERDRPLAKQVNNSKSKSSTVDNKSTPKSYSGKSISRINSKSDVKQNNSPALRGVPTRRARIVNSTPNGSSGKNTPSKLLGQSSSEYLLSPIARTESQTHSDNEHQGVAMETNSQTKLTKQDRVNSDDQMGRSRNSSDLDTDGDNILAAALARLGERTRETEEEQQLHKNKTTQPTTAKNNDNATNDSDINGANLHIHENGDDIEDVNKHEAEVEGAEEKESQRSLTNEKEQLKKQIEDQQEKIETLEGENEILQPNASSATDEQSSSDVVMATSSTIPVATATLHDTKARTPSPSRRVRNEELVTEAKSREERMQQRNAELSAMARRLEEKSKLLQKQHNNKV